MKPSNPEIDQRLDSNLLKDNCAYVTEKQPVRHNLSEEEIADLKNDLFMCAKDMDVRTKAVKLFKEAINNFDDNEIVDTLKILVKQPFGKQGLKELKSSFAITLKKINTGYEDRDMELYAMPYYELSTMAFYSEDGSFVYDRDMHQNEKQLSISANLKKLG